MIRRLLVNSSAGLVGLGLLATPAVAVDLPQLPSAPQAWDGHGEDAYGYRHRRWRHHDRIDGGDILAGVLVLGAVAAIADAASDANNSNRRNDDDYRRDDYRNRPVRYSEPVRSSRSWGQGGIDNAIDLCVAQVERGDERVASVDQANRDGSGWQVAGSLADGSYFSCRLDNDGRIRAIDMGDGYSGGYGGGDSPAISPEGNPDMASVEPQPQWSDEAYARARTASRQRAASVPAGAPPDVGEGVDADLISGPQPAYPGGPLPGEAGYEDSLGG